MKKQDPLAATLAFFDQAAAKLGTVGGDVIPPDYFPASTFAKEKGFTVRGMKDKLDKMVQNGLAETQIFKGRFKPTTYYRILSVKV